MATDVGRRSTADHRAATAALITAHVNGVDDAQALALMRQVRAWHSQALFDLHDHLTAHPDAFTSGASSIPQSLLRLIWALIDDRIDKVTAPRCAGCHRAARDMPMVRDDGRLCVPCYRLQTRTTCARCGRATKNAYRRAEGIICASCRDAEPPSRGTCPGCGHERPLRRRPDGTLRCDACIPKPAHTCSGCGILGRAVAITDPGPLCNWCYQKSTARPCGSCGRTRPIARKATATTPDLCLSCRPRTVDVCTGCQRRTFGNRTDHGRGPFLCQTCQPKVDQDCALCGQPRPASAIWPVGPVCRSCYQRTKHSPTACAYCQQVAVLIGTDNNGRRTCGTCAGADSDYRCIRCHSGGIPFRYGLCERCVLDDEIARMLAGAHDADVLSPLATALRASRKPEVTVRWLRFQPAGQLLMHLAEAGTPITHAALDQIPQAQHVHKIRQVLVRTGVLPERDEYLDRIPSWLADLLRDQPAHHSELVRLYARWFLLHRARRRSRTRAITAAAAQHIRSHIRAVLSFLGWLDSRGNTLAALSQHDIDAWLDQAPASRYRVRQFVKWAQERRAAPPVTVPADRESPTTLRLLDEDDLYRQLRRCLHEDELPLDVRVAGGLMLLFGIRFARLVQLTVDAVNHDGDGVHLIVGRAPIRIPPPLDQLLARLAAQPIDPAPLSAAVGPARHLFPGAAPGLAMRPAAMSNRLRRHSLTAEPARQTALLALTADLPAAVIADLLGIGVNTALRWANHTAPDWAAYLDARTATRREHGN